MLRKANVLMAVMLASHLLLSLPLAFAIHAQNHSHTVRDSSESSWYDEDASQCELCVHYTHQALDIVTFTFTSISATGWTYCFFLPESSFASSVDVFHLRGPPAGISV